MRWYTVNWRPPCQGAQVMALGLLVSVFLLTSIPLCGCLAYADPAACCQQHTACGYKVNEHGDSDDAADASSCYNPISPPSLAAQAKSSALPALLSLPTGLCAMIPTIPSGMAFFDPAASAYRSFKFPILPVYIMTAAYRI